MKKELEKALSEVHSLRRQLELIAEEALNIETILDSLASDLLDEGNDF